ncbi:MAG: hypothetical protein KBE65_22945 [Phycisphaerae bacterium]|nr:hypothetical protein [Phycisphaerae bacterium]
MIYDRRERVFGTLCRVLPMALLMALVVSWLVWGPFGIMCYVGGLFNWMGVFMVLFVMMLPALVFAAAFPVLAVLAAMTWRRRTVAARRRITFWVVLTGGFVVPYVLRIVGLGASPFDLFVRGFTRYAGCRVYVAAIQSWLTTLDPNDYRDSEGVWIEGWLAESEQPQVIADLHPKWAQPMFDRRGRLIVQLLWGGGMIGHWGIVIGPRDTPEPLSDPSREQLRPLAPGAYVCHRPH